MNESCPIYDEAKSQVLKGRDPYMNENLCETTLSYEQHDYSICDKMTPSYMGHDSFIGGIYLLHMWDMNASPEMELPGGVGSVLLQ